MKLSKTILVAACLALTGLSQSAAAQTGGPISLVVPYPAGGTSDFIARTIAPVLSKALDSNLIVENLGGAGGALGSNRVLQRPADGRTLLLGSPNEVILAPAINTAVEYKSEDFRLVGPITDISLVLVGRTGLEANDAGALLARVRDNNAPAISYGSVGIGSLYHVTGAVLSAQTGDSMFHVPYRGVAPLVQDLIGGQVDISFLPMTGNVLELLRGDKFKVYGLSQPERNPLAPEIPTLGESAAELKDFAYSTWGGLLVRADTPDDIVGKLQAALAIALADPQVRAAVESSGTPTAAPLTLEQADQQYRLETEKFRKIIVDRQISVN